ncbi:hypothetical protein Verru16b_00694 [Lacunisphaera limnophila]|uniref:Lipoprotein n=1 Tax=Lacunisphaera limnophila TaxID=1838286 RepID=A0A1D8ARZ4_9BACT|nr:hypothetical protein [Lacunisphaera limnophila]AOS43642.1 hypothetical protein Verru16b_00694 [Lacunisphaera limnophila]
MQSRSLLLRVALIMAGGFVLTGCISRGPASIAQQRGPYSEVLALTDKEELLTNIVRLAYLDAPVFLQVASVTASPSIEYGTESELRLGDGSSPNPLALGKPKVIIKDSPTIVYRPLLGKEFSSELLMPFDIRAVFLMIDNGFDFSVLAQLLFKQFNHLSNARSATTAERAEFRRVTDAIARLLQSGALRLGTGTEGLRSADGKVVAELKDEAVDTPDGRLLISALGLDPGLRTYELKTGLQGSNASIALSTRSLQALLSYMSNYVQPPPEHAALVWPTDARSEPDPLMRILSSRTRPDNADPAVFYKGYWFYVRADDLRSRNTLFLIRLLFNLQAQASSGDNTVQLTLPVK